MKHIRAWALGAAALTAAACGTPEDDLDMEISLPLPESLSGGCPHADNLVGQNLQATLLVSGGFPQCNLNINEQTRVVTGTCYPIRTGKERFVMLSYTLAGPSGRVPLAYHIGLVDLTERSVQPGDTRVDLHFATDSPSFTVVDDPAEYDAMPTVPSGSSSVTLVDALYHFRTNEPLSGLSHGDLDLDNDTCGNLRELCNDQSPYAPDAACPP